MTRLIPVGEGLGVQIPPHLLKAAHLDDASDLFFEVTMQGLLIKPPVMTKKEEGTTLGPKIPSQKLSLFLQSCNPPSDAPADIDALIGQAVLDNDRY